MKTVKELHGQIMNHEKSYQQTKDFEEFRKNIFNTIEEIQRITPIIPFFSNYFFQVKMDCENMEPSNVGNVLASLETFLKRLN
ncbi:hypothetical protein [Fluviicola sp.]|uniref:hypothetical protein n=1 Tax=Fluviicola sp. TaxID=1917219 RepID=UPI003D2E6752